MAFRVTFSGASRRDIADIVTYIADDNPKAALRFHDEMLKRCEALSATPDMGVQVHSHVRRLVFGSYLIFYRVMPDRIQIVRILHGAQRIPANLGG